MQPSASYIIYHICGFVHQTFCFKIVYAVWERLYLQKTFLYVRASDYVWRNAVCGMSFLRFACAGCTNPPTGAVRPPVLSEVFSSLVPLRRSRSESVPVVDLYIPRRHTAKNDQPVMNRTSQEKRICFVLSGKMWYNNKMVYFR